MQIKPSGDKSHQEEGTWIELGGVRRPIFHHPTDFSVKQSCPALRERISDSPAAEVRQLAIGFCRVSAGPEQRDTLMEKVRREDVAHHIYKREDTGEEVVITDEIFLTLEGGDTDKLKAIL